MSVSKLYLLCLLAAGACAQTTTGTIGGVARDPSGAAVPGAVVTVTGTTTGVSRTARTNAEGRYVVAYLLPGEYDVTVEKKGFRRVTRSGIQLDVQQDLSIHFDLPLGEMTFTAEVTGSPSPLATSNATVATTIANEGIVDLPLNDRAVLSLSLVVPGVYNAGGSSRDLRSFSPALGGGRGMTSEVMVDGSPLSVPDPTGGARAFGGEPPSVDAVEEFTVQVNALAAEYGRTGGGIINVATRRGTNQLHGTAREFFRNSRMDANGFFSNRAGVPLASFQQHQYGISAGGPVVLPKLFDGRNRTFFFADLEIESQRSPRAQNTTAPLDKWKLGDFSGLANQSGQPITIYDPLTTRPDGVGGYTRSPFPGNVIPDGRIDPVARNLASYWPEPNTPSVNAYTELNNFYRSVQSAVDASSFTLRLDHGLTAAWRTYARFNRANSTQEPVRFFPAVYADRQTRPRYSGVWDNTYIVNPTTIVCFRYGFSRFEWNTVPTTEGFDSTHLGFPPYLARQASAEFQHFPGIIVSGLASLGGPLQTAGSRHAGMQWVPNTHIASASATQVLSRHVLKAGVEFRKSLLNFWQVYAGGPNGNFSFDTQWSRRDPARAGTTDGFGFASFLLGLGTGNQGLGLAQALASSYSAGFVQDDFRASGRLTVNFGVRYELDLPRTERYNRLSYFDSTAPSPIAGQAPGFPNLAGVMRFAGPEHRRQTPTDKNNIGPRFGFAYAFNSRTVARGGYALMYDASLMQAAYNNAGFEGFRVSTPWITSLDSRTPYRYLRDPFPDGFQTALGAAPGPASGPNTDLGLSISDGWFLDYRNPVIQQWNANLQRQLPGSLVVEAGYIGSKGNHILNGDTMPYNQLPASALPLGNSLNDQVPNPFYGVITNTQSTLSRTTVQRRQLLKPFPQYAAVNPRWIPIGNSLYHALTLRVQKRFSGGAGFLLAYTAGKLIGDCESSPYFSDGLGNSVQDVYNRRAERALSNQDISSRLVLSGTYELPFGAGRRFLSNRDRVVEGLLGGWQLNALVTLQSGEPIPIYQFANNTGLDNAAQRPNSSGESAKIAGGSRDDRMKQWFNISAFSIAPAFTFGNAPRTLPDVRQPGIRNFDLSLFKNFCFKQERLAAQFRVEAFNAFNTTQFGRADSTIGGPAAGTISSVAVAPRQLQLALRLIF